MSSKEELKALKEIDTYSLVLFVLYMLSKNQKYSTLSELAYTLDKQSLLNLLDVFGGLTITIPTKEELQLIINALLIYQAVKLENTSFAVALNRLGKLSMEKVREVTACYDEISSIVDKYYAIT